MLTLSNLSPNPGSTKKRKRIGRGPGSGHGKTSTRGHKGAKARSGSGIKPGFEGGQMPLQRRIPKRGFTNLFKKDFAIVNLKDLERFEAGSTIDRALLAESGLVSAKETFVKLLGTGDVSKSLTIKVDKVSESAKAKVEAAGGKVEVMP
ncbi:MAG: 50S ribosomal protein L15 [Proteobacteria bacterium]|nr:50S ribosomal protein L15 [Pseudomonadota bacterium]MBU1686035.1 50S ribosomal protein L15 [Pseudomonadota bacterium]